MLITIASGKGGTGKTTVAVNLALALEGRALLADCDVEEPNCHLFLPCDAASMEPVCVPVPEVDPARCTGCGECARLCQYSAIVSFGTAPLIFPEMCHGCGGCTLICPEKAIHEINRVIGEIEVFQYRYTIQPGAGEPDRQQTLTMLHGRLNVGEALAPPVIRAVQDKAVELAGPERLLILDSPPGTACPAAAALKKSAYAVLVTEPTAFGLNDLKLAVAMARELRVPCGIVVNRLGSGDNRVQRYCERERLPLLAEIPDDRRVAQAYSHGEPAVLALPEYREVFLRLHDRIIEEAARHTGDWQSSDLIQRGRTK